MTGGPTIDVITYRRAIGEMLHEFAQLPSLSVHVKNQRLIQIAYGWCSQVYRFGRAVTCLVDNGFGHESEATVRSMLEYTITLHWLVQVGDRGVDAVFRRHQASLRAIEGSARGGNEELIPPDLVADILAQDVPKVDEEGTLRRFEAICRELGLDHNLYVVYRLQCGLTHPTFTAAATYIDETGDSVQFLDVPRSRGNGNLAMAAHCMVWAGRAFDELLVGRPLRRHLQRTARSIGSALTLPHRVGDANRGQRVRSA